MFALTAGGNVLSGDGNCPEKCRGGEYVCPGTNVRNSYTPYL